MEKRSREGFEFQLGAPQFLVLLLQLDLVDLQLVNKFRDIPSWRFGN
jgi:hypothetical protein